MSESLSDAVREAAHPVARELYGVGPDAVSRRVGFEAGAVWVAGRLPSREALAKTMFDAYADPTGVEFGGEYEAIRDLYLTQADAVLALIREHITKEDADGKR